MSRYVYPVTSKATTGRIDQGKDFGGAGVVRAIGDARVVKIGAPGWPGGEKGVLYRLLNGPAKGKYVYTYEGIAPSVHAGQTVKAGQPIGTIIPGTETGIEMGWANVAGEPISHGEYTEGKETAGGKAFARFLERLKVGHGSNAPTAAELAKHKRIAGEEDLGQGGLGLPGEEVFEKSIPNPVEGIASLVHAFEAVEHALENPETLLLNAGLVGGGAFLIYYGAMQVLGVRRPVAAPAAAAAGAAAKGAEL